MCPEFRVQVRRCSMRYLTRRALALAFAVTTGASVLGATATRAAEEVDLLLVQGAVALPQVRAGTIKALADDVIE